MSKISSKRKRDAEQETPLKQEPNFDFSVGIPPKHVMQYSGHHLYNPTVDSIFADHEDEPEPELEQKATKKNRRHDRVQPQQRLFDSKTDSIFHALMEANKPRHDSVEKVFPKLRMSSNAIAFSGQKTMYTESEVRRILEWQEEQLRHMYDQLLQERMQELFDNYTQFSRDSIHVNYSSKPQNYYS